MKKSLLLTMVFLLTFSAAKCFAEAPSWNIDNAHSNFYFSVDHIYSKVNGRFEEFSGTIKFSPDNLKESKIIFEIKVDSINTYNGKRDKHLLSPDFFNEPDYPQIRFESNEISAVGNNVYDVKGKFNIMGKDYDLTLPLTFAGSKAHPMMKNTEVAGFNGTITIDRLKYGVGPGKFFKAGVVGKDVDIFVSLEVLKKS